MGVQPRDSGCLESVTPWDSFRASSRLQTLLNAIKHETQAASQRSPVSKDVSRPPLVLCCVFFVVAATDGFFLCYHLFAVKFCLPLYLEEKVNHLCLI